MNLSRPPGAFNRRVAIEAPVETADGAGGVVRSYEAVARAWAEIAPASARDISLASIHSQVVTHRVFMRAEWPLSLRHRLRFGHRVLRIVSLRDADGSGRFHDIRAEEVVD